MTQLGKDILQATLGNAQTLMIGSKDYSSGLSGSPRETKARTVTAEMMTRMTNSKPESI
jgi:hypothetical protein